MSRNEGQRNVSLSQLVPELGLAEPFASIKIRGVTLDSRQIRPGYLFIALKGTRDDGNDHIAGAISAGAVAVFVASTADLRAGTVRSESGVPIIAMNNLGERVSDIASSYFDRPSIKMRVIGVTGTNGKSTCVSLIAQLAEQLSFKAATIGTLGVGVEGAWHELGMTTPDAITCQRVLAALHDQHVKLVAMEISSHGLDQNRVSAVRFASGVFTNLSHDHLDYHKNLQQYAAAKQKLFGSTGLKSAIINLDDPFAAQMVEAAKQNAEVLTYSLLHFVADVFASDIHYSSDGVQFNLQSPWGAAKVESPLLGEFNVYNVIAALAALAAEGFNYRDLTKAVRYLKPVPGRMQKVVGEDVLVVVDYAHTPDALAQAIAATRVHTSGDLWVVFGCGGDRDRTKRAAMARIAENYADHVVVTSDNPRNEKPDSIIAEICSGFIDETHHSIVDREEAICFAVQNAQPGDVVLVAGKGHENYQLVGSEKRPFDDVTVSEKAMQSRAGAQRRGGIA